MNRRAFIGAVFEGKLPKYIGGMLFTALSTMLMMVNPLITSFIIDNVIDTKPVAFSGWLLNAYERVGGRDFLLQNLLLCGLSLVVIAALSGFARFFGQTMSVKASESIAKDVRIRLYRKIHSTTYDYHLNVQNGDLMQRCTSDIETFMNFVSGQFPEMVKCILLIGMSVTVMMGINWKLTLISFAIIPFLFLTAFLFFRQVTSTFTISDAAEGFMSTILEENISGMRIIRAFATQQSEIRKFEEASNDFFQKDFHVSVLMSWFWGLSDLFCQVQIGLALLFGTIFAINGEISIGNLVVFITYTSNLIWPMRDMGRVLADMGRANVSIGRICEVLMQKDEEVYELNEGLTPALTGGIRVKDLNFGYGGAQVLHDISFEVKPGQTLAILGRTGSGKSTLLQILVGLLPYQNGSITLDGVELGSISKKWLRKNIGIVLQEPFLYSKNISENVAISKEDAAMADIERVTRIASVFDVINDFENGFDTMVGERGVTLSGGQKQRVAIARTLLGERKVLIFDDSLSAVDVKTDAYIRDSLRDQCANVTKIIVAHRISTLKDADQILVMDGGRIVDRGTHSELLTRDGLYRQVYEMQNSLTI